MKANADDLTSYPPITQIVDLKPQPQPRQRHVAGVTDLSRNELDVNRSRGGGDSLWVCDPARPVAPLPRKNPADSNPTQSESNQIIIRIKSNRVCSEGVF